MFVLRQTYLKYLYLQPVILAQFENFQIRLTMEVVLLTSLPNRVSQNQHLGQTLLTLRRCVLVALERRRM